MGLSDPNIANVFTDGQTPRLSLMYLRILGFLYVFRGERDARRISNILKGISAVCARDERDVIGALNHLVYWKRPLIWADSRSEFEAKPKSIRDLRASVDTLDLTVAGVAYFNRMIMSIMYVQEATTALSWKPPLVPIGSSFADINVRFRTLRAALRAILKVDHDESEAAAVRRQKYDGDPLLEGKLLDDVEFDGISEKQRGEIHVIVYRGTGVPCGFEAGAKAIQDARGDFIEAERAELRQQVPIDRPAIVPRRYFRDIRTDRGEVLSDELAECRRCRRRPRESFRCAAPELDPKLNGVFVRIGANSSALAIMSSRSRQVQPKPGNAACFIVGEAYKAIAP